jgi:drug/metabolite transporter (DMT)-like permease
VILYHGTIGLIEFMNWFLFSLFSAIFYAFANIIGKYVSDEKSEPIYISFIANLYATVASFIIVLIGHQTLPFYLPPMAIIGLTASGLVCVIGTIIYWSAMKMIDISEFTLFTRTQILFVFIGSILVYRESFLPVQIIGIICVIIGSFIICYKKGKLHLSIGAILAILSSLFFSIEVLIDKSVINYYNPALYTAFLYLIITILLSVPVIYALSKHKQVPSFKTHKWFMIASTFYAISAVFFYNSYTHGGNVTLTSIISQIQIPIVVIYGIFIFKERTQLKQKIIAMLLMIIGALLLQA